MSRLRVSPRLCLLAAMLLLLQGCARSHYRSSATKSTPGLTEEDRKHGRNGTNPNAPFMLVTRPQPAQSSPAKTAELALDGPPCAAENLGVVEVAEQVNGNERFVSLAFVNGGDSACRIGGYPALSLQNDKGQAIGSIAVIQVADSSKLVKPAETSVASPSKFVDMVLAPKAEAYFGISWLSGEQCPSVSRVIVEAPGLTRSFSINHPLTVCSGQVRVTALRPTQNAS